MWRCKYCDEPLQTEVYGGSNGTDGNRYPRFMATYIAYCDNDNCPVQPCSNAWLPSRVVEEMKCFGYEDK